MAKFKIDLQDKVVVITGSGGIICGGIAEELAQSGAKLALIDLNLSSAEKVAAKVREKGGVAKAYGASVIDKNSLILAHDQIVNELGSCDILINGAGGNNARATTDNEYCDIEKSIEKDFFALEESGVRFVFDLNFLGTFLTTQIFAKDMIGKKGCS
ncbi:MAG TPA: SDR family NAD(P)-dependent oxidoreductase, partial [Clostridia bacterium]|nr:SDR family NAD(P)-dependent oxidoreductase [Clostridia bacterium]